MCSSDLPSERELRFLDLLARQAADLIERTLAALERERAEAALRHSEKRRDLALEAAQMGAWDYDLRADVCHFDARAQELYNLPSAALDHRPEGVAVVVHPDDVDPMFDTIQRASDVSGDGRYDIDYRIAQADGKYRWLRAWGKAEFEGEGDARRAVRIVGASRDVTLEKEAQHYREHLHNELVASQSRLAAELEAAQRLQSVSTNLISEQQPEVVYEQLLDAAMALMKADAASVQMLDPEGLRLRLLASRNFHPESAAHWQWVDTGSKTSCGMALDTNSRFVIEDAESWAQMAKTQDLLEYRRSGVRSSQSTPLIGRNGKRLGMISTLWREPHRPTSSDFDLFDVLARQAADLIERGQSERALRMSEERLRGVLNGMGEGFELLAPDFTILEHSREALLLNGRPREEIVGRSHWEVYPGTGQSELGRLLKKAMADRAPVSLEDRYTSERERRRWLEMRAYPIADGALAVFWRDVTDRKEAEQALRESEEKYRILVESIDGASAPRTVRHQ